MFTDVIWDFDGTLFDTYPGMVYAFKKALKDFGIEETEDSILKYMKVSVTNAINYAKVTYGVGDNFIEKFLYYEKNLEAENIIPFPFSKEICEAVIRNGGRNFIVTHRGNSTFKYLKYHNMFSCFTEIVNKHNGFKRKPDSEAFLYVREKYKINPSNGLAVGDRECDIVGSKGAGLRTCLYNTNNIECDEKADFVINSLEELYDIIRIS